MSEPTYIWIVRWEEFQHYAPSRERGPAWIKDYTAQMSDERYLRLSDRRRALLRDLRDVFATFRGRLPDDTRMITRQRCSQTRRDDLQALNDAGFIRFLSREGLDLALEEFYTSRAPARSQEEEVEQETDGEVEKALEQEPVPVPEPEVQDLGADIFTDPQFQPNGAGAGAGETETPSNPRSRNLRLDPHAVLARAKPDDWMQT